MNQPTSAVMIRKSAGLEMHITQSPPELLTTKKNEQEQWRPMEPRAAPTSLRSCLRRPRARARPIAPQERPPPPRSEKRVTFHVPSNPKRRRGIGILINPNPICGRCPYQHARRRQKSSGMSTALRVEGSYPHTHSQGRGRSSPSGDEENSYSSGGYV